MDDVDRIEERAAVLAGKPKDDGVDALSLLRPRDAGRTRLVAKFRAPEWTAQGWTEAGEERGNVRLVWNGAGEPWTPPRRTR